MKGIKQWKRKLFLLGLFKIPMVGFVRPELIHLDEERCEIGIRLKRRTKNHLNSMYFGSLAVGADLAPGLLTYYLAEKQDYKINFVFKSMRCEFLQRAETDIRFICEASSELREGLKEAYELQERRNIPVKVIALNSDEEEVATFVMEVSFRVKK